MWIYQYECIYKVLRLRDTLCHLIHNGVFKSTGEVGDYGVHRGGERSCHMANREIHRLPVEMSTVHSVLNKRIFLN